MESVSQMCPQCPWRVSNHGKRSPGGFYTKKNLRRLWGQIRRGERAQSCHLTDPSHPDHVAAGAPENAQVRECPGSIALVARELKKLENAADWPTYKRENPRGLTLEGAFWWANRVMFQGSGASGMMTGAKDIPAIPRALVKDETLCGRLG